MIQRLGLILIGVLLACLGLEVVLRFSDIVPEVGSPLYNLHESDPYLGWIGKPNVHVRYHRPEFDTLVRHDSAGWRQPEPPRPANPVRRILVLGDSFTWGWGVSQGEVFTDRLQAVRPTVAIYNRGVIGFGTAQEYLLLGRELATATYDDVVVMFYLNDLADNIDGKDGHRPFFELADGQLLPRNRPPVAQSSPVERWLKDYSRVYSFAEFELGLLKRRFAGEATDERYYRERGAVDFRDLPGYAVTARLLHEMSHLTREHGARFFLVYIPQRSEFERESPYPYVHALHAMVNDIALREGITVVDLSMPFREQTRAGRKLLYEIDAHWTPAGHQLAADVLLSSPLFQPSSNSERSDGQLGGAFGFGRDETPLAQRAACRHDESRGMRREIYRVPLG